MPMTSVIRQAYYTIIFAGETNVLLKKLNYESETVSEGSEQKIIFYPIITSML